MTARGATASTTSTSPPPRRRPSPPPAALTSPPPPRRRSSLDTCGFTTLSLKPLWPPRLEYKYNRCVDVWSWEYLPAPPFQRSDVVSYAMDPRDGNTTFLVGTAMATFAFDTTAGARVWKPYADDWSMPFTGRAHFVSSLDAFVGLSKDPDNLGRLCSCKVVDDGRRSSCRVSMEKLFSEDPAEDHVGATLVYMGESSNEGEFCLVQCVSIEDDNMAGGSSEDGSGDSRGDVESLEKRKKGPQLGEEMPRGTSYFYRLTTFSLGYDDSNGGGLTTGESCRVQCYRVPETITQTSFLQDPVAFWM
ncbi:hypothetical protein HU200_061014 [Digitaria exilis]|uniref:Uncharacterized protein n=1 Tax=Digitaria exilis TaxID=1010633 RepID=A0A835AB84_9POAL|nr:hypothetical protein HU200_061014 [Digitaria exilis]